MASPKSLGVGSHVWERRLAELWWHIGLSTGALWVLDCCWIPMFGYSLSLLLTRRNCYDRAAFRVQTRL